MNAANIPSASLSFDGDSENCPEQDFPLTAGDANGRREGGGRGKRDLGSAVSSVKLFEGLPSVRLRAGEERMEKMTSGIWPL